MSEASEVPGLLEGPERLVGSCVLDFQLTSVLGAGGMSVVYRGVHRVTRQEVAVKVLPPELAIHDELKARFVEEARLLALLEHPNIVTLNNFTETGGRLCLIMQFVDGVTFEHQLTESKQVPWKDAVHVGIEVCRALEHAHKQGIIHRDIKPSNVIVRADGSVKVTDFGIAKMVGQSNLTSTGQTMGTVRYMSPEQVRGRPLDARSDLYSLGVTLFEGLAGKSPFDGDNQFAIMEQHLNRRPPTLASFGAKVPAAVEEVLLRALEKKADDRFASAAEFRQALEIVALGERANLPASTAKKSRTRRVVASVLGLVVLGAGLGFATTQLAPRSRSTVAGVGTDTPPTAADKPSIARAAWPDAYSVPDVILHTDERLAEAGLRVQSTRVLSHDEVLDVAARYAAIVRELNTFLVTDPKLAGTKPVTSPLNLVTVPEAVLNDPKRWPGFGVEIGRSYGSRYVDPRHTLFVADSPRYLDRELPYGVALHVLTPIDALSNDAVFELAERFAASHLKNASPSPKSP